MDKRTLSTWLARNIVNPITKPLAGRLPFWALLETKGRKSGEPRQVPVGNGLDGDTFWIVSEHGRKANYVRNMEADPRVRVRVKGRWRAGTAHALPDDDPAARQKQLGRPFNTWVVRTMGTDPLTVRIDLDP
jgi:deazaflavin-dependent oxidoreductase (nitroreductase family)